MSTRKSLWDNKHAYIIAAATDIFLQTGYATTSMDAIAEKAKVSKITIYKHFKDKADLFNQMMAAYCQTLYVQTPLIQFSLQRQPHDLITEFSLRLIEVLLQPRSLALMRTVIAESIKFPEIASAIWENGRMPLLEIFQDYLAKEEQVGRMKFVDKDLAARQFFGMIKENAIWPVLIGMKNYSLNRKQLHNVIKHSVIMFLNYYGTKKNHGNYKNSR